MRGNYDSRNQDRSSMNSRGMGYDTSHRNYDSRTEDRSRRADDYSQNFYDRDENSRYRTSRGHHDWPDHDRNHEHRGFFDRVSDWFSGDDDRDNRNDYRR